MSKRVARGALLVAIGVSALMCFAQVWQHIHQIGNMGNRCDFPEDCIANHLPGSTATLAGGGSSERCSRGWW
jgi:hypothetical protein